MGAIAGRASTTRTGVARIGDAFASSASVGLTAGHVGNGWAGFIQLGSDHGGIDSHGGLFHVDLGNDYHGYHGGHGSYYPYTYYYDHYSPFYSYPYYEPYYGYSYQSLYYEQPYIYRPYASYGYYNDTSVGGYDEPVEDDQAVAQRAEQQAEPLGPYPTLPGAQDQSLVGQGNSAFAAGRFDEARSLFARAMLADERDGHPKLLYAVANFALGDYEVAATALRRALLTTNTLLEFPPDIRAFYGDQGLWEAHLRNLAYYVTADRTRRSEQLLLSYLYFATGDTGRALAQLAPVTESDPTDDVAALLLDAVTRVTAGK